MTPRRHSVSFFNGPNRVAADFYLPADRDDAVPLPAVVLSTPGSSVKEQIGANYARRLAARGIAALTFDPSFQGESGGDDALRDLEDPSVRVDDLRCAIDFLNTQEHIDPDRIGMLGICAGGGYAVRAAVMDGRVAALGTVVAVDIGRAMRDGIGSDAAIRETLVAAGSQRAAEAGGDDPLRTPWIPDSPEQAEEEGVVDPDVLQAVDFYRTPRGHHPRSTNRLLFRSMSSLLTFDAFFGVERLLSIPLQVIVGSRRPSTGSKDDGERLQAMAPHAEEMMVIEGAGHYELYDTPHLVDRAVDRLAGFFDATLAKNPGPQAAGV